MGGQLAYVTGNVRLVTGAQTLHRNGATAEYITGSLLSSPQPTPSSSASPPTTGSRS